MFSTHGGGPLPLLGHPSQRSVTDWLANAAQMLPDRPKAIVAVTAHWVRSMLTLIFLLSHHHPSLLLFLRQEEDRPTLSTRCMHVKKAHLSIISGFGNLIGINSRYLY